MWWNSLVRLNGVILACIYTLVRSQTGTPGWALRASAIQRYLSYDVPFDYYQFIATHNSYSTDVDPYSHSQFETANQYFSLVQQMQCLGVRGIEIDVHYIEEIDSLKVCHTSTEAAEVVYSLCNMLGWDVCGTCGLTNYGGDDTLCSGNSAEFSQVLSEVRGWLDESENSQEVLYIKLELFTETAGAMVMGNISEYFGLDKAYTPEDLSDRGRIGALKSGWPSLSELLAMEKQAVFLSAGHTNDTFPVVFPISEISVDPENLFQTIANTNNTGFWDVPFTRTQGDASFIDVESATKILYEANPSNASFLSAGMVREAMSAGLSPTFDLLDAQLLEATIWSWDTGYPSEMASNMCAYMSVSSGGRWTEVSCEDKTPRYHACSSGYASMEWTLSNVMGPPGAASCEKGSNYGAPIHKGDNNALVAAMQRANIDEVWVNVYADADGCWVLNGNAEERACLSTALMTEMCSLPPPVIDRTPLNPCIDNIPIPWSDGDYAMRPYHPPHVVIALSHVPRVGGSSLSLTPAYALSVGVTSMVILFVVLIILGTGVAGLMYIARWRIRKRRKYADRLWRGEQLVSSERSESRTTCEWWWCAPTIGAVCLTVIAAGVAVHYLAGLRQDVIQVDSVMVEATGIMVKLGHAVSSLQNAVLTAAPSVDGILECQDTSEQKAQSVLDTVAKAKTHIEYVQNQDIGGLGMWIRTRASYASKKAVLTWWVTLVVIISALTYISLGYGWCVQAARKTSIRRRADGIVNKNASLLFMFNRVLLTVVSALCIFLLLLLGCAALAGALIATDVCQNPRETIPSAQDIGPKRIIKAYTTCTGVDDLGFFTTLKDAYWASVAGEGALSSLSSTWEDKCPDMNDHKDEIAGALSEITDSLSSITSTLKCSTLHPLYRATIEDTVCRSAAKNLTGAALAFWMTAFAMMGLVFCFRRLLAGDADAKRKNSDPEDGEGAGEYECISIP